MERRDFFKTMGLIACGMALGNLQGAENKKDKPMELTRSALNIDEETAKELFTSVTATAKLLKEKLGFDAVNLLNNNGKKAGQVVNHYHMHIIPRYGNDECYFKEAPHDANFEELAKLHKQITE